MAWIKKIGIDLGTANTLIWVEGQGIVVNEPTVVALSVDDNQLVAVGTQAKQMLGRTPGDLQAAKPLRDGVVADYTVTQQILSYYLRQVAGKNFFFKPEVMICVPGGCTQVERRAVLDATLSAGARTAYLIDEPLAAAIGAGIPIGAPVGSLIVDSGGGATEAAVICLGGVVVHQSIRLAGNKLDEAIANFLRKKHNLVIGEQTAEEIKLKIGSALALPGEEKMAVKGRDAISGLPRLIELTSTEVTETLRLPLGQITNTIKAVLEETPPELASDIIDKGIVLSGGTSLLRGYPRLITQEVGVSAFVVEQPMQTIIKGIGIALENLDLYKRSIIKK